jgi:hypothetical protein
MVFFEGQDIEPTLIRRIFSPFSAMEIRGLNHSAILPCARNSNSRYIWSTNTKSRHNSKALYFDAETAPHCGKYLNDMWNSHANNCELRWNPAKGRVEVYALRDILLSEVLGMDYGAPFWYQPHNGLTTRDQARRVQAYYQRSTLPWLPKPGTIKAPSNIQHTTPTPTARPPQPPTTNVPSSFVDLTAPPGPTDKGTQLPPPAATAPTLAPYISASDSISEQIISERRIINHHYGLDCTIRSCHNLGQGHRIQHPQLYRLCTGGLISGNRLRALLDLQGSTTPTIYTGHLDNWGRDPLRSNTPSRRLLQQLFSAHTVLFLHNHDNVHWGLSITLRKANHHHVLYLDSLNNRYPALEEDLTHFWTAPLARPMPSN